MAQTSAGDNPRPWLPLLGAGLEAHWGSAGTTEGVSGSYRSKSHDFTGRRWDMILRRAVRYVYAEIRKLDRALERRQAKLRKHGWEHYAARHGLASVPVVPEERPKRHIIRSGGPNHDRVH